MNKIVDWFTRKRVALISFVFFLLNIFGFFSIDLGICPNSPGRCNNISELIISFTFIFISSFIFSLVAFRLKDSVFIIWRNFSFFAILVFFVLISLLPTYTHGLDFVPLTKGIASLYLTVLYSIISFFLILFKSFQKEN